MYGHVDGFISLGKHIGDKANGAYDCFKLPDDDKLINAQNYAFCAAVSTCYRAIFRLESRTS